MRKEQAKYLSIGDTAKRSGVAASALRFYESKGLIQSLRGGGNQRLYHRAMLRRISIIRVAQTLGLSLKEISSAFTELQNLRNRLGGCIGCGCLSLKHCALYNADDRAASNGAGPRYLLGDTAPAE